MYVLMVQCMSLKQYERNADKYISTQLTVIRNFKMIRNVKIDSEYQFDPIFLAYPTLTYSCFLL